MVARAASFAWFVACLLAARLPSAAAQESSYCRKVKARAAADAVLLMMPKLVAQGLRFPSSGRIGVSSVAVGDDVEVRAGLEYSPVEALRGSLLGGIGDADCRQHDARRRIEDVLATATDHARMLARRDEADYLAAHRGEWLALLDSAQTQLAAGLLTVPEVYELHRLTQGLERRLTSAESEVARLKVTNGKPPVLAAAPLARGYIEEAAEYERRVAGLRKLDPWGLTITGGLVPLGHDAPEWFGFAEVSFSFGALARDSKERRYLGARDDEVRHETYELPNKLEAFRQLVAADLSNARRELSNVEAELGFTKDTLNKLGSVDAPGAVQGRATLILERISAEADQALLRTQIRELSALAEGIRES